MSGTRRDFSDTEIERIWQKASRRPADVLFGASAPMNRPSDPLAALVLGHNPANEIRYDFAGRAIKRSEYGKLTEYGWEIDHEVRVRDGGSDDLSNLRPTHWMTNRQRG